MIDSRYPYELPPLPYDYNALEPYIDEETMRLHHDKHFAGYVTNLNNALKKHCRLQRFTLEEILSNPMLIPVESREVIMNNAGGVYNHYLFFEGLSPAGSTKAIPKGKVESSVNRDFGGFEEMKEAVTRAALEVFGSGWACLAMSRTGCLQILKLKNQETALKNRMKTILLIDVWEHAYYLQFQNRRADYVSKIWNVLRLRDLAHREN